MSWPGRRALTPQQREAARERMRAYWTPERRAQASAREVARRSEDRAQTERFRVVDAEYEAKAAAELSRWRGLARERGALGLSTAEWMMVFEALRIGAGQLQPGDSDFRARDAERRRLRAFEWDLLRSGFEKVAAVFVDGSPDG